MYRDGAPLQPESSSHNVYESYINHGNHASGGGVINIHQTNYQLSLSNSLENGAVLDERFPKQPKRRLTNSGATANLSRSKRQRIGDFVKITLDIAKQSTDFGNPLKAALAGVSALVEHYEEFEGVKDEIEGLLYQLNRLTEKTATATINGSENTRHTDLIIALGTIERRSHELFQTCRTSRFVDNGNDSAEVARLVDQFRETVVHYQKSQQQAIYDQITDLASSFNTLLKLQENSPGVKNKLDSVMARLDQLCSAEDSDDDSGNERWEKLFNTLRLIRDNGNALYNRINTQHYTESEDDIQAVSGIAEDIRAALLDYQLTQQRVIYDQNCKLINAVDLAVLNNCRRARGAEYRHGSRRGCLRGTREVVLNDIESWIKDFNKSSVFWLNGLAGTGKSTIAQTIAERVFADGVLGASFFCSRDFEDRSNLHFIFPTLAFQLAHKFPSFLAPLVSLLQSNPDVVDESLYYQMQKLIVEPLRLAGISTIIIVDALDECKDDEPSSAILSVLGRLVEQIPRVKFFITGRPEPRIKTGFRLPLLKDATKVFVLHDVHPDLINNDIQLFLKHELKELALRHRLDGWPSDEQIGLLCHRAAGLFVYAVATVKFLDSKNHLPERRLDMIVNVPRCTALEGKTQFRPRTTLDSLYMSVLQMAFSDEDPELDSKVRSIIGVVVLLVNPLPPSGIAELTNLDPREVMLLLTPVQSLLVLDEDTSQPVKPFHKSFFDFVTDPARCIDTRFCITPEHLHLELAINCLGVLNNGLEQSRLNLPDYALNSEVKDLQTRVDDHISVALRYACQSWYNHLTMLRGDVTNVMLLLRFFLEKKFLAWLQVLSVLKATRGAVVALERLIVWLQEVSRDDPLLNTARDCFYFVTGFFEPINASATHIWQSALELSPLTSIVRKLYYHQRLTPFPRVELGIPDSREPSTAIPLPFLTNCFAWSPCGQFVAIQGKDVLTIQDALTFELVSTLHPPAASRMHSRMGLPSLAYSPDGHFFACTTTAGIAIWDIQTGGVAKMIQCNLGNGPFKLVWSSDGGLVSLRPVGSRTVDIYDVASGKARSSVRLKSDDEPYLWAHNKFFRVMTTTQESKTTAIDIFGVGSALTKIESFSIQLEIRSFSPSTYRVSGCPENQALLILDIRNSGRLLFETKYFSIHGFSCDGAVFAAHDSVSIHIWNFDGSCYIPWRRFPLPHTTTYVAGDIHISPTSSSILVRVNGTLRIWRLDGPSIAHAQAVRGPQLDVFSPSGTHIATADHQGKTITITNLLSQAPSQFIETSVGILGLGLTGNVLLMKGHNVVTAWLLTEEGRVITTSGNGRAGSGDSIWSISVPIQSRLQSRPKFSVEGETGVIKYGKTIHAYDSRTGEVLDSAQELPRLTGSWYCFDDSLQARDSRSNGPTPNARSKYKWTRSDTTWSWTDGWLKDEEGKCLLWLPNDWRMNWRKKVEWFPDISTLKLKSKNGEPITIKLD